MGLLVVILLVVLGIALLVAIVKAMIWLAVIAIAAIAGVIAWRRFTGWFGSRGSTPPTHA